MIWASWCGNELSRQTGFGGKRNVRASLPRLLQFIGLARWRKRLSCSKLVGNSSLLFHFAFYALFAAKIPGFSPTLESQCTIWKLRKRQCQSRVTLGCYK